MKIASVRIENFRLFAENLRGAKLVVAACQNPSSARAETVRCLEVGR